MILEEIYWFEMEMKTANLAFCLVGGGGGDDGDDNVWIIILICSDNGLSVLWGL